MVQNGFRSGIHSAKARTFPGADARSGHDLVILNFRVRLKKTEVQPGASIMEAYDRQVTTVFTIQSSFHHGHSTNPVS